MNLTKVSIHGFKRFRDKSTMYVDGKLVSIIGANEAGKSSFLSALVHWNDNKKFSSAGSKPELSRDTTIDGNQEIVSCMFTLDENDRKELIDIPESEKVKGIFISKSANGSVNSSVFPKKIVRDISSRINLKELFTKAIDNKKSKFSQRFNDIIFEINSNEEIEEYSFVIKSIEDVVFVLNLDEETLGQDSIDVLKSAKIVLEKISLIKCPQYIQSIPDHFLNVINNEERQSPNFAVKQILSSRKPIFLLFGESERTLKSEYVLDSDKEENKEDNEEVALNNLLEAAGLNIDELVNEINEDNRAKVETLIEKANNKLKAEFKSWKQSSVYPKLKLDEYRLTILFGNLEKGGYDSIAQRSDGLRQFVALFTFIKAQKSSLETPKILLIDEAETHLHYDAQADFIQMLTEQDLVNKVIYTTHSMGCLPEDLGNGVRFIQQNKDEVTSSTVNWFWENNRPGFHSILYNMGLVHLLSFLYVMLYLQRVQLITYYYRPYLEKRTIKII